MDDFPSSSPMVESLSRFIVELNEFETTLKQCDQVLSTQKIRHSVRGRMYDCGMDIAFISDTFARIYAEALAWAVDDLELARKTYFAPQVMLQFMLQAKGTLAEYRQEESRRGLSVAVKAFLFFVRAFHDSAYGVLVEVQGQRAPKYPSMHACLKKQANGPASHALSEIPGYAEWFEKMREWRNRIKSGTGLSFSCSGVNVGVAFIHTSDENARTVTNDSIHLRDLMEAVRYSIAVLRRITSLAVVEAPSSAKDNSARRKENGAD